MAISKLTTLFALLAAAGVEASADVGCPAPVPTTFHITTTIPYPSATASVAPNGTTSVAPGPTLGAPGSGDAICVRRDSPGASAICGGLGVTSNKDGAAEFPIKRGSVEQCADLCNETDGCKVFSFNDGQCQMYHNTFDNLGFVPIEELPKSDKRYNSAVLWYQTECFLCENTNWIISGDDFEDGDIGDWAIISDNLDDFIMDVQNTKLYNGRETKVFRVAEVSTSGACEVQHFGAKFNLEQGQSYQVTFYAKADARGQKWPSPGFHKITPVIWNAEDTILEWMPEQEGETLPMGGDWYRLRTQFEAGTSGKFAFSFVVNASGKEIDWYFDDILIETI